MPIIRGRDDSDITVQNVNAEDEAIDNSDEDIYNPPDACEISPVDDGTAQDKDMSLEIADIPTVQAPTGGCTTAGSHAGAGIWILFGLWFAWTILERRYGNESTTLTR